MKNSLILHVLLLILIFQFPSCRQQEEEVMVRWKGNNDVNDLVFIFKKGITYEQKQEFQDKILYKPNNGRGQALQDGVADQTVGIIAGSYDGGIINFSANATIAQREKLKKAIESSPAVYKVFVHVVPNEIKDP